MSLSSSSFFHHVLNGISVAEKTFAYLDPVSSLDLAFERETFLEKYSLCDVRSSLFQVQALDRTQSKSRNQSLNSALDQKSKAFENAKLIHHFANHEWLAIEGMAYVLLKFPDTPLSFQKGILKILKDEQKHLMFYNDYLLKHGYCFGDFDVSTYFWDSISDIQTPLDYLARMSLTFEGANLDFAKEYEEKFRSHGEVELADRIAEVYEDEVSHLAFGVHWSKIMSPDVSDEIEVHQRGLRFPLNLRRARGGSVFDREGRKKAGMSEDWIDSIELAGGSRGQVPRLFYMNPEVEVLASGGKITQGAMGKIKPLISAMVWMARESDFYWTRGFSFSKEWLREVKGLTGGLPEFISDLSRLRGQPWIEQIEPWAKGQGVKIVEDSVKSFDVKIRKEIKMDPEIFSKAYWSIQRQEHASDDFPESTVFSDEQSLHAFLTSDVAKESKSGFLLKLPFGASGRGHRRYRFGDSLPSFPRSQGSVVVEPFLEVSREFSTQYEMSIDGDVRYLGSRQVRVDAKSFQFQDMLLFRDVIESILLSQVKNEKHPQAWVFQVLRELGFHGAFGIDSFMTPQGKVRWVSEVNARMTMGRVGLEIERVLKKNQHFLFKRSTREEIVFTQEKAALSGGVMIPVTDPSLGEGWWVGARSAG